MRMPSGPGKCVLVLLSLILSSAGFAQQPCAAERSRLARLEAEIRQLEGSIPTNKPREVVEEHRERIRDWHQQHDAEVTRLRQQLAGSSCQAPPPPPPDPCQAADARRDELAADLRRIENAPFPTNKPEEIAELRRRAIQQWHAQHDAEVNQLNLLLSSSQCPATRVHVTDENGANVAGAVVFADGKSRGSTDSSGRMDIRPPVAAGSQLVARKLVLESATGRQQHAAGSDHDWKYRVYVTSVRVDTLPPPDPCASTRARLDALERELVTLSSPGPPLNKPAEVLERERERSRRRAEWHKQHDAEVNSLTKALADSPCSDADLNGHLIPFTISDPGAVQELRLSRSNTLIGLHWVVSLEWDASQNELEGIKKNLEDASQSLYNATDGQFVIERAELFDDAARWEEADVRVYVAPIGSFRSHVDCPRGGFFGSTLWCGDSWIHMARDEIGAAYTHEFGHYGFDLGDEYEDDDPNTHCTESVTGGGFFGKGSPMAACMMWSEYSAAKLCSGRRENPHVNGTGEGDQACWSRVREIYSDPSANARWIIQTPDTRGSGLDGRISPIPVEEWLPITTIDNHSHPSLCRSTTQTFLNGSGQPIAGADVWALTTYGQILYLGRTSFDNPGTETVEPSGMATLTGLHVGDTVAAFMGFDLKGVLPFPTSFLNFSSRQVTAADCNVTFSVARPGGAAILSRVPLQPMSTRLSMNVVPSSTAGQVQIVVKPEKAPPSAPIVSLVLSGQRRGRAVPMQAQPGTNDYAVQLQLPPTDVEATIRVDTPGAAGNILTALASIAINQVDPEKDTDLFSNDGRLSLTIPAGTMRTRSQVVIGPSTVGAPPLSGTAALVSGPFNVQASSGEKLSKPAVLRFQLSDSEGAVCGQGNRSIYRYDAASKQWDSLGGTLIPSPINVVTQKVTQLGVYALVCGK